MAQQTVTALGSLSLHRSMAPNTLSAYMAFHADITQFKDPQRVLNAAAASEMIGRADDEVLVGEVSAGLTFFDPCPAGELNLEKYGLSLADRFNDQVNFHVRVPAITALTAPYFRRLSRPLLETPVAGVVVIENISAFPDIEELDVLNVALRQMSILTAASEHPLLWLHSDRDIMDSERGLHQAMAEQHRFKKDFPHWSVDTFARVEPAAGTMCGLLPARARWSAEDDFATLRGYWDTEPDYLTEGNEEEPALVNDDLGSPDPVI